MPTKITQLSLRQLKGLSIAAIKDTQIKRINKLSYRVKSQTSDLWYSVVEAYGSSIKGTERHWTCTCADYLYRKTQCKHIFAVLYSKQLRKRIVPNSELAEDTPEPETSLAKKIICPKCNGLDVVKREVRRTKRGTGIQRYWCKPCNYRFVVDSGFDKARADPKTITAALDLYFKGLSLRAVADHLKRFHGIIVTHVAVLKWIKKFVRLVRPYVDQIEPAFLGGIFNVDEMMVHVRKEKTEKGHFAWLWNLMDSTTRYWMCAKISQRREIQDARAVFQQAKEVSKIRPKAVIHDGLRAYDKAFDKEFFTMRQPRTLNVRSVSVRHEGLNSKIERLNGTVRDREVVMRGMDHKESAQDLMDGKRIEYNFVRAHQALGGKTPAEVAGIRIVGDIDDNMWIRLVKNAKAKSEQNNPHPDNIERAS